MSRAGEAYDAQGQEVQIGNLGYEQLAYHYERAEDYKRAADYFQKAAGKVRDMSSDTAAEKLVTKGEGSLTKLHESCFLLSKWVWGLTIAATLGFGWLVVKHGRDYFYAVLWVSFLALMWVVCLDAMYRGVHYVIHSHGLRVAGGALAWWRFVYNFDFSDFEGARIPRWWEPITTFTIGGSVFSKRGVMITLRRRLPWGLPGAMGRGAWSRRVFVPHSEPEVFLKELNSAWNRWRLTHGEGQTDPKSGSSTPASPPASTTSPAA